MNLMSSWMECTTCHRTVRQNETGVCLGCQGGFCGEMMPDDYFMQNSSAETAEETYIERGDKYAFQEQSTA